MEEQGRGSEGERKEDGKRERWRYKLKKQSR